MGKITFFEESKFQGKKYECSVDCTDFRGLFLRCNSIKVEDGAWVIYERPNFGGCMYVLEKGEYPDFKHWKGMDGHISSCRQIRPITGNPHIQLYEYTNFSGQKVEIKEDTPDLLQQWNHREVNSVRVLDGAWVLFEESDYQGRQYYVEKGEYRQNQSWGALSPCIMSIRRVKF
ncbi:gamma-crystallin S-like isoform X2 [Protopterus annectens]|uniref:gamma-crystallin S-like isoform X2 n=1 Tax=Protopterus annectens TaxID=7888 RepID=UPI001CFC22F0|nr:gamma-crystallin S-like isoform X2 [Protopterus annectens]